MGTVREPCKLRTRALGVRYGDKPALRKIDLEIAEHRVTAVIGPSGCGKSTLLRCFNRMHDLDPAASYEGQAVLLPAGIDLLGPDVDPVEVRMRVGMVFQKPNPFPKSIFENVVFGLRVQGRRSRGELEEAAERTLRLAGLWDEVRDRLHEPATALSGGQQQRLCIARALATGPEVLLLDEPTSALDPIGTATIEDLIGELKREVTIVIVTHSMQQAARVSDYAAFLYLGELIEFDRTERLFVNPSRKETQDYITGRFG